MRHDLRSQLYTVCVFSRLRVVMIKLLREPTRAVKRVIGEAERLFGTTFRELLRPRRMVMHSTKLIYPFL